jgi:AraC-like DNA-binding protein
MAIGLVLTCTEPDQMEAAHAAARAIEVMPTAREGLAWHVTRVELDNLWLIHVQESGPRIRYVELNLERTYLSFLARPGPEVFVRGVSRMPNSLMRHAQGEALHERTSGPTEWVSVSLPTSELMAASSALAGHDLSAPRDHPQVVMSAPGAMANLLRTQTTASDLARNSPHLLANVEVARALKQSLIGATIACLSDANACQEKWVQQTHDTIMRRFRRVLAEHPHRPIYMPEICAAIGVPERTLRLCCQERLGMSPKQYLTRRRMYIVQRELLSVETEATGVTEIATRFGFWHLGRFSAGYHAIFGELPSTTLARRRR